MGEKKKSNANTTALIGAAFLMATSAIGPGFLTQTATFTGQYGSIFALAIICTILLDVTTQLNIWSIIGVSGMRGQISQIKCSGTRIFHCVSCVSRRSGIQYR